MLRIIDMGVSLTGEECIKKFPYQIQVLVVVEVV